MTLQEQLKLAQEAVAKGIFRSAEINEPYNEHLILDGWVNVSAAQVEKTTKSIKGTTITEVKGFVVDVALPDGDVGDIGEFEGFFDALKAAAGVVANAKIDSIAENWSIGEQIKEAEMVKDFMDKNPGYLHKEK